MSAYIQIFFNEHIGNFFGNLWQFEKNPQTNYIFYRNWKIKKILGTSGMHKICIDTHLFYHLLTPKYTQIYYKSLKLSKATHTFTDYIELLVVERNGNKLWQIRKQFSDIFNEKYLHMSRPTLLKPMLCAGQQYTIRS